MRKVCLIFLVLMLSCGKAKSQFLFDFLNLSFGLFQTVDEGGYEGRITLYNNTPANIHGLKGVWRLGERFKIGYTMHYGNNVISSLVNRERYRMYLIETGMFFEYVIPQKNKWYLSFPLQFSGGAFYIPPIYVPYNESNSTTFFSVEPRVQINKPLLGWLQVSASLGYRFISAHKLYGTNNQNLAGPSLNFSLVFGNFK
jgi:hypothetical protein